MKLHGQRGYAMVALLVGLSIASLLMTATMPVWSQMAKREREAELIFRLGQYSRAIRLFSRRAGPGVLPPNIDVLVQQKHLRKKYKDPMTGEDFQVVSQLTQTAITPPGSGGGRGGPPQSSTQPGRGGAPPNPGSPSFGANNGNTPGGIAGVVSTSKEESLRVVQGRTHYNEWVSTAFASTSIPGGATGAGGASATPGVVGSPGGARGGAGVGGFNPGTSGAGRGQPTTGPGGQGGGTPAGPGGPRTVPQSPQPFDGGRR